MDKKHKTYKDHPVYKRLLSSGPKRILSLDGGGIRGALTLGYLEEIEKILRDRYRQPKLVLSDYFDLIGGTSTGAIIATLIALGKPVKEIKELYLSLGNKIFKKRFHIFNWSVFKYLLSAEFDHSVLEKELKNHPDIKDLTLGSEKFKTGLAIFAKRADTFKTYGFHNHPSSKYYEENKGIYLSELLRATSAAPSYFKPKEIKFSNGESAVFIDGGVSMANNPSLMLFLMTTIKGYGYQWRKSKDHMLMISMGTGFYKSVIQKKKKSKLLKRKTIFWASELPDMFMNDATEQNQYLMQYFSNARIPEIINSETGDLTEDLITSEPLLDYCRYNTSLDQRTLASLGVHVKEPELSSLPKMEKGENAERLYKIGQKDAAKKVSSSHFPKAFDFGINGQPPSPISKEDTIQKFLPVINEKGVLYKKFKGVFARQATEQEIITSITSDGIETMNTANPGDYIVRNQTESKEYYVIKKEKFPTLYEHSRNLESGESEYSPKGKVNAIQLTADLLTSLNLAKHFYITASWNQSQYVGIGDCIVSPINKEEVYRIGFKEFRETYKIMA